MKTAYRRTKKARSEETSVLSKYFAEIRGFPLLTRQEERQLARDIQAGSRDALNELVAEGRVIDRDGRYQLASRYP